MVFLVLTCLATTFIPRSRVIAMTVNTLISVIGLILMWKLNEDDRAGRMTGLTLAVVYAINLPISLSVITSNVAGFTKQSVVSSLIFISYCVGNMIGPQFFISSEEPSYPVSCSLFLRQKSATDPKLKTGMKASIASLALSAGFLIALYVYYVLENRRRDRLTSSLNATTATLDPPGLVRHRTDRQIEGFRYIL